MSLILHLSDLHLADWDTPVGDYAKGVHLAVAEQLTVGLVLEESMQALRKALEAAGRHVDAVVVSGDVTSRAEPAGFDRLRPLLELLGDRLPDADRVLVVPGNHDVDWSVPPSSTRRYDGFLSLRTNGYSTALLEGVDIALPIGAASTTAADPIVKSPNGNWVLIGMNSANYCGTPTGDLTVLDEEIRNAASPDVSASLVRVQESLRSRETYDLARIDSRQFRKLEERLAAAAVPESAVRILVLHHHIAPVTSVEELKPFESIVNLGQLNDWIITNHIDVVLHGHKHVSRAQVHAITSTQPPIHRRVVAVIGAPAIESRQTTDFARLIEVPDTAPPRPRVLQAYSIPGRTSSASYTFDELVQHPLVLAEPGSTFSGVTITAVHDQLMAQRGRYAELVAPIVCRVEHGSTCHLLPAHYPDLDGKSGKELLAAALDWWQRPIRGRAAAFNHGERLWSNDGGESQLERVVNLLRSAGATGTSQALAVIVEPGRDHLPTTTAYPSFVTVQFLVTQGRLDLIATFRKQEMPHWWPINMAELAYLQAHVISEVAVESLSPGHITTVTAVPRDGASVPRVDVPWLDRQLDSPSTLMELVGPLLRKPTDAAARDCAIGAWDRALSDWTPPAIAPADGDRAPVEGLQLLADMIHSTHAEEDDADVELLVRTIRDLAFRNRAFFNSTTDVNATRSDWITAVATLRREALEIVPLILSPTRDPR